MTASYIVTFIGDDRPGLVEQLSRVIESNGGNWHESRLSQLGGKFAGIIRISLPADKSLALEAELSALATSGLSVRVTASGEKSPLVAGRNITLTVLGPDRPGIVREISRALALREINVLEMQSQVISAPMSAEMIFSARIDAWIPEATDTEDLVDTLDEIANQMTLEIDLE
jgi:glycine cleavage system regulatory protein